MKRPTPNNDELRADACDTILPRTEIDHPWLVLSRGAARTTIIADQTLSERTLLVAQCGGSPVLVQAAGERVTVRPTRASLAHRAASALLWARAATTLRLSTAVRWAIAIQGGASCVTADLRALQLRTLEVNGGASEMLLDLPRPVGVVQIRFDGGVYAVTIRRPEGVSIQVVLSEGGSQLALDGQYLHAIAGPTQLAAGAEMALNRYVVSVAGGANHLIVDTLESAHTD